MMMAFAFLLLAIGGLAVTIMLIEKAVTNGIRRSGLIDWRTLYELERKEDIGQPTLDGLHESCLKAEPDAMKAEAMFTSKATEYVRKRTGRHSTHCLIVAVVTLLLGSILYCAALFSPYDATSGNSSSDGSTSGSYSNGSDSGDDSDDDYWSQSDDDYWSDSDSDSY